MSREIPLELLSEFTQDGAIPVYSNYRGEANQRAVHFTRTQIDSIYAQVKRREKGHYRCNIDLYKALDKYPIVGKDVLIVGSRIPWHELTVVEYGGYPTTIDYNPPVYDHPSLKVVSDTSDKFDIVFSISSFEHSGLGRYGDTIDPNADIAAMQWVRSRLKPGGLLFLAVPVGKDALYWNAHRVYGELRLPRLLAGWKLVHSEGRFDTKCRNDGNVQPILILK